jgi:hypothetical protein
MADEALPPDLAAFLRALELSEEYGHGRIDPDEIALVEAAWEIPDTVVSSYGWVLSLQGGRRIYLEYTIDNTRPGGVSEELTLTELQPGETYPTLDDDTGVFWYRPDQLNLHLGIRPPSLH